MRLENIKLKEKSPEYADDTLHRQAKHAVCDMEGCKCEATHKAPKDRTLNNYYNFCLEHVTAYNSAWDYFDGLSAQQTEQVFRDTLYGERPTRKMSADADFIALLRHKAFEFMEFASFAQKAQPKEKPAFELPENHPVTQALRLFGLSLAATPADIRSRYKALVKQWHPDLHGGSRETEEKLKQINMAYTLLKVRLEE